MKALARAVRIHLTLIALLLLSSLPAAAQNGVRHLFYEAVVAGSQAAPYAAREALTGQVQAEILPDLLAALQVPPDRVTTELRMGGYLRETNPALHSAVGMTEGQADRLALALGWTLSQDSVLVSDLDEWASAGTGYAVIAFTAGTLTPDLAQRFFLAAAAVHDGLGGGYTAFGDRLLFLNLRGTDGRPYSGLEDASFVTALGYAASRFPGASLAGSGRSTARLVESAGAPQGLGEAVMAQLRPLRDRHAAQLARLTTLNPGKAIP